MPSTGDVRVACDLGGTGGDVLMVDGLLRRGVDATAHLDGVGRLAALDVRGRPLGTPAGGMDWHGTRTTCCGRRRWASSAVRRRARWATSLLLAEQARPGVRGLWLFEPIVFPPLDLDGEPPNALAEGARRRRTTFASADDAYANFASKPPLSELHPAALAAYVEHGFEELDDGSLRLRCEPEVEAQTYEMGMRHDAFARLGEVRCPVTVLRGRVDRPGPASVAPLVAEALPAGVLEDHPELGHFGPLEDPAAMAASIRSAVTAAP